MLDRDPDDAAAWAAPSGPAQADPDPADQREHGASPRAAVGSPSTETGGPPAPVTLLPGRDPAPGEPGPARVQTAAGVSAVTVELDGSAHDVVMTPEPATAGTPPTWVAQLPVRGEGPIRYRYAWRSSWTGGVTEWMAATPARAVGTGEQSEDAEG